MRTALAEGTSTNLKVRWGFYFQFCNFYVLKEILAILENLCLYALFLGRSFVSVDIVRNYISGVKILHLLLAAAYPTGNLNHLGLVFKDMARKSLRPSEKGVAYDSSDPTCHVEILRYDQALRYYMLVCVCVHVLFNGEKI